jgi:hypothetical protein
MKTYQYKIQWLFPIVSGFLTSEKDLKKELFSVIKILGARSLDKIIFRDKDLKILDYYNGYIQFPYGSAEVEAIKYIKKALKENDKIYYVELLRK